MNNFGHITDIDPNDSSTWENKYFVTFDIDWAVDEILSDSIDLIEQYDIPVTWFVTHKTPFSINFILIFPSKTHCFLIFIYSNIITNSIANKI